MVPMERTERMSNDSNIPRRVQEKRLLDSGDDVRCGPEKYAPVRTTTQTLKDR